MAVPLPGLSPPQLDPVVDQSQVWLLRSGRFLAAVLLIYVLSRLILIPVVVRAVDRRNPNNYTIVNAVHLYLRVATVLLAIPVGIAAAGFGGIAAGSGVIVAAATLALGVAGQDVIGNFVSGVFLVADPGFNIGDYIEWGDHAGTIRSIDLRVTRMQTPGGETIIVPNTDITTSAVQRPYANDRYRVTERLVVGYDTRIEPVRAMLTEAAAADDRITDDPGPVVNVTELGGGAIELTVWFWVADPQSTPIAAVRTEFATRAKQRLLDEGVSIAPASTQELSGEVTVRHGDDPVQRS